MTAPFYIALFRSPAGHWRTEKAPAVASPDEAVEELLPLEGSAMADFQVLMVRVGPGKYETDRGTMIDLGSALDMTVRVRARAAEIERERRDAADHVNTETALLRQGQRGW